MNVYWLSLIAFSGHMIIPVMVTHRSQFKKRDVRCFPFFHVRHINLLALQKFKKNLDFNLMYNAFIFIRKVASHVLPHKSTGSKMRAKSASNMQILLAAPLYCSCAVSPVHSGTRTRHSWV